MVAANDNFSKAARALGDFIGRRSVTYDVAKIHDGIERGGAREASFQRFEVGVNVAKQQYAQGSPDGLAIIEQHRNSRTPPMFSRIFSAEHPPGNTERNSEALMI